jgi:hypothetical protein
VRRFLFFALAAATCARPKPPSDFTLRVAVAGSLLPLAHDTDSTATTFATDIVYEQFLRPGPSGLESRIFERWEHVGPHRVRALVAEGIRFSDGSPVSPEDLVRVARAAKLMARAQGRWLELGTSPGAPPIDALLLFTAVWKPTPGGELGTGPYRLVAQRERLIALERVHPVPGRIRRVEIVSFPSVREALARAVKGEANAVIYIDERHVELVEGMPRLKVLRSRGPHMLSVVLNARSMNRGLRRELAQALPVDEIAEVAQGRCAGPPPGGRQARSLRPGPRLQVAYGLVPPTTERAALSVRRALGPRGGDVVRVDPAEALAAIGRYDLFVMGLLAWPPELQSYYWTTRGPWNYTGYSNPAYDAAVDAGDRDRAEAELRRDPPVLPLCRYDRLAAVDARLKDATLGTWGVLDTLPDWEVSP